MARQDIVTQLIAQVRRVGGEVPNAGELITAHCTGLAVLTGQGYGQPRHPRIAWDEGARNELVSALVNDALATARRTRGPGRSGRDRGAGRQAR